MKDVAGIDEIASNPVGDVLTKTAICRGCAADNIILSKGLEPCLCPFANRLAHRVLIHIEVFGIERKVKAVFPSITKTVRPLAGITVSLVPAVVINSAPPLLLNQRDNQLQKEEMPLAVDNAILHIQHEGAVGL